MLFKREHAAKHRRLDGKGYSKTYEVGLQVRHKAGLLLFSLEKGRSLRGQMDPTEQSDIHKKQAMVAAFLRVYSVPC